MFDTYLRSIILFLGERRRPIGFKEFNRIFYQADYLDALISREYDLISTRVHDRSRMLGSLEIELSPMGQKEYRAIRLWEEDWEGCPMNLTILNELKASKMALISYLYQKYPYRGIDEAISTLIAIGAAEQRDYGTRLALCQ